MDAATGHIEVAFQTYFSTQETIEAIKRHKQKARDNGIIHLKKDKQADSPELEVTIKMEEPKEVYER